MHSADDTAPYRVFLSSPSDVALERDRVERVVERLNSERIDRRKLHLIRWEDHFYRAEAAIQDQIDATACELVVCIFWKRLGTELPERYKRSDGTIPTGTEFEFESAMQAAAGRPEKLPDVLVYRKTAAVQFSVDQLDMERAQYDRFMAFWQRWFRNEKGHFLAGFHSFPGPDEFEAQIEANLRLWLRERENQIVWDKGSPYRGLEPFDVEHAPIFFGRRREVERARARLIAAAMGGTPFLLVTGASGAGKSSLARAGLIPRLSGTGGLSTLAERTRWLVTSPGQLVSANGVTWSQALAAQLSSPDVLGKELARGDFSNAADLARTLERAEPDAARPTVRALERVGDDLGKAEERKVPPRTALLVLVDQLEELFLWPHADAERFARLLGVLCREPGCPVVVLATLRSDFEHRLAEIPELLELAGKREIKGFGEGDRTMVLGPPTAGDLRDMILLPARAALLTFESSGDGHRDLASLIEAQAAPELMPAVQYLLRELYERRRGSVLTLQAFDELKGVGGVMAARGEKVFAEADAAARAAFPGVVRALVTQSRSDVPPSIRRVPTSHFGSGTSAGRFVQSLQAARLVTTDGRELKFAHDSLLKGWQRLREQIADEQRLYEARERLEQLCRRWVDDEDGQIRSDALLLQGLPLAEGRDLVTKWGKASLEDREPELPAFIDRSDRRDRALRRRRQIIGWSVASALTLLSVGLAIEWRRRETARIEAAAETSIANARAALHSQQISAAVLHARDAFDLLPSERSRSVLLSALHQVSAHQQGQLKAPGVEALGWVDGRLMVVGSGETVRRLLPLPVGSTSDAAKQAIALPVLQRRQDGNTAGAVALRGIGDDRSIVLFNDGSIAVAAAGRVDVVWPAGRGMTLHSTTSPSAIGPSGALIATASIDADAAIVACRRDGTAWRCAETVLDGVRAHAVAVAPDETRVAIADEAGGIALFDATGAPIAKLPLSGARVISMDWSSVTGWIAVGDAAGNVSILDGSRTEIAVVHAAQVAGGPVTALRWHPRRSEIAFSCGGRDVCHWPVPPAAAPSSSRPPIRRLSGHSSTAVHLAWHPAGDQLATAVTAGSVLLWGMAQDRDSTSVLYGTVAARTTVVVASPDGRYIAAGYDNGAVEVWNAKTMAPVRVAASETARPVEALAWPTLDAVAMSDGTERIAVVPVTPDGAVQILPKLADQVRRLAFADQGRILLAPHLGDKRVAVLAQPLSREPEQRFLQSPEIASDPYGVAIDRSGAHAYVSYRGGDIHVWSLASLTRVGTMAYTLTVARDTVAPGSLSVSPDGRWLATSGGDNYIRVYDIEKRTSAFALAMGANEPHTVGFSPDGKSLAALAADGRLYVWAMREAAPVRVAEFSGLPESPVTIPETARSPTAQWFAWIDAGTIAVTGSYGAVNLINLDEAAWRRRIDGIAPKRSAP